MLAFFDQHTRTDPRLEVPWWLRDGSVSATPRGTHPLDQETLHTNERIQRWIERWKRQIPRATRRSPQGEERYE